MITVHECFPCFISQGKRLAQLCGLNNDQEEKLTRAILALLSKTSWNVPPASMGREVFKVISAHTGQKDPYKEIKERYNGKILEMIPRFEEMIQASADPYLAALKFAVAGNIIDFGTNHAIDGKMIMEQIEGIEDSSLLIDHSQELRKELREKKTLLYLGDNCGEIVFDRVFIEFLMKEYPHLNITFAVRGGPIINDITRIDAAQVGIDNLVRVIDNGDVAPGTDLKNTSASFKEEFYKADLIISKGQGNYECLNDVDRSSVFFLFMAKCGPVAASLSVPQMSLVCQER